MVVKGERTGQETVSLQVRCVFRGSSHPKERVTLELRDMTHHTPKSAEAVQFTFYNEALPLLFRQARTALFVAVSFNGNPLLLSP